MLIMIRSKECAKTLAHVHATNNNSSLTEATDVHAAGQLQSKLRRKVKGLTWHLKKSILAASSTSAAGAD